MSFVDDFDLSNYETVEELKEARSAIRSGHDFKGAAL